MWSRECIQGACERAKGEEGSGVAWGQTEEGLRPDQEELDKWYMGDAVGNL